MHLVVYNNKLEHKYTLTPIDPRLLYIGPIQANRYLSVRYSCLDLYSYLSVLCVLSLAACSNTGHLSVQCSVGQLLVRITQLLAYNISY